MKRNRSSQQEAILRTVLRDRRVSLGVRQKGLAEKLNVHQSFVSKYESGERFLTFVETIRVWQALELDPYDLLAEYLTAHDAR